VARLLPALAGLALVSAGTGLGHADPPPHPPVDSEPTTIAATPGAAEAPPPPPPSYDRPARSYGTKNEPEPPPYVRPLAKTGVAALAGVDWLDVGLDHRTRYELHNNDFNRNVDQRDESVMIRTRAFVALRDVLDPVRFTIEVEDARRYASAFPEDDRDVNTLEPIQLYGELYFGKRFGMEQHPISVRAGRMAFEQVDRRLIARNNWRNTTNTFQGVRTVVGQTAGPWQVDAFALQPLERLLDDLDERREGQWFLGAIGTIRRWSDVATLQPYYLHLRQAPRDMIAERQIHSPALRAFGMIGDTPLDFDVQGVVQFGNHQGQKHRAWGLTAELGYTFEHAWKTRVHASYGHATGDRDPTDDRNQRFERMFGFARPFSNNVYFLWENFRLAKARIDLRPEPRLRVDFGYGAYSLDSATDRWQNPGLRDMTGQSGRFLGHELDLQIQTRLVPRVDVNSGYLVFVPGEFPSNLGRDNTTHFVYVEVSVRAF
jgi:hypothetical protein